MKMCLKYLPLYLRHRYCLIFENNYEINAKRNANIFFLSAFFSQQDSISTYDRLKAFDGDFYLYGGSETRSVSGKPGHAYWQNKADYIIDVELDTLSNGMEKK